MHKNGLGEYGGRKIYFHIMSLRFGNKKGSSYTQENLEENQ